MTQGSNDKIMSPKLEPMNPIPAFLLAALAALPLLAVPPVAPTVGDLARRSDVIAVVTITNVMERAHPGGAWNCGTHQSAVATVETVLKGRSPETLHLSHEAGPMSLSCRPPGLEVGRFLVFLHWENQILVRTDVWYSQAQLATNHVMFPMKSPMPWETVLAEIRGTAGDK